RSPGEHRDPADPRLPRRVEPRVRRARQLQPRDQGADHLSRDRVRQDRHAQGNERGDQHHREDGRRGARAARGVSISFQALKDGTMAKLAVKLREQNRRKTVAKFKVRRQTLQELLQSPRVSDEDKETARAKLQKLPRDASPVRLRNRCALTGRPRGVYRKFGLGRTKLRELAMRGEVPGVIKASW